MTAASQTSMRTYCKFGAACKFEHSDASPKAEAERKAKELLEKGQEINKEEEAMRTLALAVAGMEKKRKREEERQEEEQRAEKLTSLMVTEMFGARPKKKYP